MLGVIERRNAVHPDPAPFHLVETDQGLPSGPEENSGMRSSTSL